MKTRITLSQLVSIYNLSLGGPQSFRLGALAQHLTQWEILLRSGILVAPWCNNFFLTENLILRQRKMKGPFQTDYVNLLRLDSYCKPTKWCVCFWSNKSSTCTQDALFIEMNLDPRFFFFRASNSPLTTCWWWVPKFPTWNGGFCTIRHLRKKRIKILHVLS